jgi:hypothetical protein
MLGSFQSVRVIIHQSKSCFAFFFFFFIGLHCSPFCLFPTSWPFSLIFFLSSLRDKFKAHNEASLMSAKLESVISHLLYWSAPNCPGKLPLNGALERCQVSEEPSWVSCALRRLQTLCIPLEFKPVALWASRSVQLITGTASRHPKS